MKYLTGRDLDEAMDLLKYKQWAEFEKAMERHGNPHRDPELMGWVDCYTKEATVAKKRKTVAKRGMAIEDDVTEEDDSEDEYEEVEETPITKAAAEAVKGGERPDEVWYTPADPPPETIVQIETSGQKRDGIKKDGVWYQRPDDWKPEDTHSWAPEPVQITRWRPKPE